MHNTLLNIGLYCLFTIILLTPARAIAQPGKITWETHPAVILRNWKQGQHKIFAATQRGIAKQKSKLPTRLMSVQLGGQAQLPITEQAKGVEQQQVSVGAVVGLNQLPQTVKRLFAMQAKKARAAELDARHRYALQLIEAYGSWWIASSLEDHIAEDIKQARQELMPLKKAFEAGQLSELRWLDLSLELANLQREHTQLRQQKQQANVYLKQLLNGEGWRLKLGKDVIFVKKQTRWRPHTVEVVRELGQSVIVRVANLPKDQQIAKSHIYELKSRWLTQAQPKEQ